MGFKGINKVIIIGNLGHEPEVKSCASGTSIVNLRIATTESWKDKTGNGVQERTEWHRVVLYNKLADIAAQWLQKGARVYIEGSLRTHKWQDKTTGQDKYTTEIVATHMLMLGDKNDKEITGFEDNMPKNANVVPKNNLEQAWASSWSSSPKESNSDEDFIRF